MPAPAMSSRHLYTGHRRGHIQAAPRLRAHRGEPLSQDHPQIPVSMPSLFRFDASAVVHTCSSSHRTPAPLTARRHPQRSPPRLLTDAACGGLESPPARRPRRTYLHHWHSTDRADDLLHHHHFPSGHTWVPIIRSWALTRGFALHPGTRNRYKIRYTRTQHRPPSRQANDHGQSFRHPQGPLPSARSAGLTRSASLLLLSALRQFQVPRRVKSRLRLVRGARCAAAETLQWPTDLVRHRRCGPLGR